MKKIPTQYFQDLVIRMAHHSTAIEGNTLTLGETKSILIDQIIPRKMKEREYYEVYNYKKYIEWLKENYKKNITLETIKETHKILLNNIRDDAGKFKKIRNIILGSNINTSEPYQVIEHLQNWINNIYYRIEKTEKKEEKIRAIMESHMLFEQIHPFPDGNGRVGRALIVHICMENEIEPIIIEKEQRSEYIQALNDKNTEKLFKIGKELNEKERERIEIIQEMEQYEENNKYFTKEI